MEQKPEIMHLMILDRCDHQCKLCCNKLYDIEKIPVATVEELKQVHTVCITGGEPFMASIDIDGLAENIKKQYENVKNVYVYTSGAALRTYLAKRVFSPFLHIDGLNIAPKNGLDWEELRWIYEFAPISCLDSINNLKSNRLYVFKEQKEIFERRYRFLPKMHNLNVIYRKWDKEFKTPDNEIFRRLPIFLG